MQHRVAHAVPPGWLFHDWHEAAELWKRLERLGPAKAVALMPDHVHRIDRSVPWEAWLGVLNGYARWRNHRRGEQGRCVFLPTPPPEVLKDSKHIARSVRYVHLNPCRDKLVRDPLTWAFTTHRDAVGLAIPGLVAPVRNPSRFHAYVSGDPSVHPDGTDLPFGLQGQRSAKVEQVTAAVSALTRTLLEDLHRRGPARTLLVQALVACTPLSKRAIAKELGISHAAVVATPPIPTPSLARLERVLGDPRFEALHSGDLTRTWAWRDYQRERERKGAHALLVKNAARDLRRRSKDRRPQHLTHLL